MTPDNELLDLAARLGARLLQQRLTVTAAESCTGGLVAGAITAIAGSSGWFDRGFVTYSNEAKQQMLGVSHELLAEFGAVSEPVARAMAEGALAHSLADLAVSVTGIAGPGGATLGKPVGMVCFGWAWRAGPTTVATAHFPGERAAIRALSVRNALQGLLIRLDSYPSAR
ncbi:MAG: nicotinamide-nucleotide amidohydrolase family protein [Betaproteobacteria bacterium]